MKVSKELVLSCISFFRIKDWFYIVGLAFLGFFYKRECFRFFDVFLVFIVASLYLAHGYSINNYFDFKAKESNLPEKNAKKNYLRKFIFLSTFLLGINCAISFFYSKFVFVLVILGGIISLLYSSNFTKFKSKPFLNILSNSSGFTILFLIGYIFNKKFSLSTLYLSAYVWLGIIPSQIIHLLAHNPTEKLWPFSLTVSQKIFYFTQIIWLIWSFLLFCLFNNLSYVFILTLLYCILQILFIEEEKKGGLEEFKFLVVRRKYKILNIIFGSLLLIIFYFKS